MAKNRWYTGHRNALYLGSLIDERVAEHRMKFSGAKEMSNVASVDIY